MDRGAWQATVHGVAKSRTWQSDLHTHSSLSRFSFYPREMASVFVCCLLSPKVPGIPWEANEAGNACRRQLPDVHSFCSLVRFFLFALNNSY